MSYVLSSEQQIDTWIENVRRRVECDDKEGAIEFLDVLQKTWDRYKNGQPIEPMTIYGAVTDDFTTV